MGDKNYFIVSSDDVYTTKGNIGPANKLVIPFIEATGSHHVTMGKTTWGANAYEPEEAHDCEEMYYITKGSCYIWLDNTKYLMKEGDFVFIPKGCSHKLRIKTAPFQQIWIHTELGDKEWMDLHFGKEKGQRVIDRIVSSINKNKRKPIQNS